jgi:putative DNA primase/helicase
VYRWLARDCYIMKPSGQGDAMPIDVCPVQKLESEVVRAIRAQVARDDGSTYGWQGAAPFARPLSVENGILDLDTLELHPHTPELFNTASVAACWRKDADKFTNTAAGKWLASAVTGKDGGADQEALVQEMMGYLLTSETCAQKGFVITGPARSGKGTLGKLITQLLHGRVTTLNAAKLGNDFGLQSLIDKTVALVADMRTDQRTQHA